MATMKKSCPPGQHMVNGICTPKPFSSIGSKIGLGIPVAGAIGITAKMIADKVKAKKAAKEEEKKKKEAEEMPKERRGGATKKYMTGGMVNANSKVSALTKAGSKGVMSGVNPKAKATGKATGKTGGISKAPKKAVPVKQFGGVKDPKGGTYTVMSGQNPFGKQKTKTVTTQDVREPNTFKDYNANTKGTVTKTKEDKFGNVIKSTTKSINRNRANRMINRMRRG